MVGYMHNPVSAPIPGQSLTGELGSKPWEKPPQYTDPMLALKNLIPRMMAPKSAARASMIMESGVVPITTMTQITLMNGVMEGKWTIDMAVSMADPVFLTFFKIAKNAGITDKINLGVPNPNEFSAEELTELMTLKDRLKGEDEEVGTPPPMGDAPMDAPAGPPPTAPTEEPHPMAPTRGVA